MNHVTSGVTRQQSIASSAGPRDVDHLQLPRRQLEDPAADVNIYNLRLSADLVVLSACQTALGREVKGEGLVGLTRGFMYAGAQRVVASLWQVDDLVTAAVMKAFYRGMLRDGLSPAAAPYYWAPFTLQGEWR